MAKAYVLASGGVDSSTCLALAKDTWEGSVCGVSMLYGQRHDKEVDHAKAVCTYMNIAHMTWEMEVLGMGGLIDEELEIPPVSYDDLPKGVSPTFVPFRNGTLLSVITSIAVTDSEAEAVYFGAHADDAANWAYPDCTPEFAGAMAAAIYIGSYHKIRLHAPLIHLNKAKVVEIGQELNVPWHLTWSCYEGQPLHCGVCPTCRSRRDAFAGAGDKLGMMIDPTDYKEAAA